MKTKKAVIGGTFCKNYWIQRKSKIMNKIYIYRHASAFELETQGYTDDFEELKKWCMSYCDMEIKNLDTIEDIQEYMKDMEFEDEIEVVENLKIR